MKKDLLGMKDFLYTVPYWCLDVFVMLNLQYLHVRIMLLQTHVGCQIT